jgi:nitrate/TMAO reductase-like tetraheme cytochrome c subunit
MGEDGVFSGGPANVARWLSAAGILLGLASAVLLAIFLAKGAAWRATAAARWLLLAGLFVLPSMTMLLGNVVGFHNTRQSCAQCHTMDPWIADMKDPKSTTLAAVHYKDRLISDDQCYTCHSGYGLAGNIQAKMSGLSHVTHYYVTGVPKEIKIKRPFPVATCLHCHAEAAGYLKIEQHVDAEMKPKILSGEMSCFECHAAPHPRPAKP